MNGPRASGSQGTHASEDAAGHVLCSVNVCCTHADLSGINAA